MMHATPNNSENDESSDDLKLGFKQKIHIKSINIYQYYLTDKIKCVTQLDNKISNSK